MGSPQLSTSAPKIAEAIARRSYGKLVAFLAARSGDVAGAEDALSDAFAAALANWPFKGTPANPEAWLLTVARRKLIDTSRLRRPETSVDDIESLAATVPGLDTAESIPDRRLALMFACAHPAIDAGIHAPLMLQAVLGLDAARIASAFLMSPAAMAQRLVRAKTKIRQARIPLHIPAREDLSARLETVLNAIYAAYSEGWTDAEGVDAARRDLAEEAIYLCRIVVDLQPGEPEALGLLALMLYAEARRQARRGPNGDFVPLAAQDVALWDIARIAEGESALLLAGNMGLIGRYQLEAAIQSAHIARRLHDHANWDAVLQLYDSLLALTSSPVAALNRAVALAEVQGPTAALAALDVAGADLRLAEYQPYWAARADLLARSGAFPEARAAYGMAIGLERDSSVRRFLQQRCDLLQKDKCRAHATPGS